MIDVDESRFPLVVVESRGTITEEDVDRLFDCFEQHIKAERRFGLAFRPVGVAVPSIAVIKRIATWNDNHGDSMARFTVCMGMHLSSAALRGALRFLHAMTGSSVLQATFSTWAETEAWVLDHLREA